MQGYRQLRQYRFFLNAAKVEEQELDSLIKNLKQQRSFSRAIRVGLRLFWSLMQGQTDVLLEEFPWVAEQFQRPFLDLQAQLARIEQKIPDADQLALYRPNLPNSNAELQTTTQLQQAPTRLQQTPSKTDADIERTLEVERAKASTTNNVEISANKNLVLDMIVNGMQKLEESDDAVIEYGIAIGRLPKSARSVIEERQRRRQGANKQPSVAVAPPPEVSEGNAKPIAGATVELPPPNDFEELLL